MSLGVYFSERMAGFIQYLPDQVLRPFEINIEVSSPKIFKWYHPRSISGTSIFDARSSDSAPVTGTLIIRLSGIQYDFTVDHPTFGKIQFTGKKTYGFSIRSFIELPYEAMRDGAPFARGTLWYLNPIWEFPFSVRFFKRGLPSEKLKRLANRMAALTPRFAPGHESQRTSEELRQGILAQLQGAGTWTLRFFRLAVGVGSRVRSMAHSVSLLVVSSLYTPSAPKNPQVTDEPQRWNTRHLRPCSDLTELEADVVVIGSGAGGASVAWDLARRGHAVLILEEGDFFKRSDFAGNRLEMVPKLYRSGGFSFPISNTAIWLPTGKTVGGTTTINSGTAMAPGAEILDAWEREIGISRDSWTDPLEKVQRHLGMHRTPDHLLGSIHEIVQKGLHGHPTARIEALPRAEEGCDGQNRCVLGCPTDAKRSTNVSFIPEALKSQAQLVTGYRVSEIRWDGPQATEVLAAVPGYSKHFQMKVRCRAVVLACGTLQTPVLIQRSRFPKHLPALGRGLTIHPALTVGALFDRSVRSEQFVPQSVGVFGVSPDYALEGYTFTPDQIPTSLPFFGPELTRIMDASDRFVNFASMLRDQTTGRVRVLGGRSVPFYFLNRKTREILRDSAVLLARMFFQAGAQEVFLPVRGSEILKSEVEVERLNRGVPAARDFFPLSAHHPLGTCRMGRDIRHSVTDSFGKVHGTQNVWITDGSAIPGPLGINPQVTIMANALRISPFIHEALQ